MKKSILFILLVSFISIAVSSKTFAANTVVKNFKKEIAVYEEKQILNEKGSFKLSDEKPAVSCTISITTSCGNNYVWTFSNCTWESIFNTIVFLESLCPQPN